jgi:Secretion system C-terminal sorting domain
MLFVSLASAQETQVSPTLFDPPSSFLDGKTLTVADLGRIYPGWLTSDRATVYDYLNSILYRTTNDGGNWRALKTFPSNVSFVRDLVNGELLVGTYRSDDSVSSLWVSSGYPTFATDCSWSKVLRTDTLSAAFTAWGASVYGQYGLAVPYNEAHGHAFWSEDTGKTWRSIFSLPPTVGANVAHMHGGAYDPWWDAIWLVNGDGVNRAIRVSMNHGATWITIDSGFTVTQMTTVFPTPDRILFGTDGAPEGIHVILRTADRTLSAPVVAYQIGDGTFRHVSQQIFKAQGDGMPMLFPFSSSNIDSSLLIVSYDGANFSQVWKDTLAYDTKGLYTFVGPTLQNNYLGLMDDGRTTDYSTVSILSKAVVADTVWYLVSYSPPYLNGGFETWNTPTDAAQWTEDIDGTSAVNRDRTNVHNGTYSVRMDCDNSGSGVDISLNDVLSAGMTYTYSFWAKTSIAGKKWKVNDGGTDVYVFSAVDTLWHQYGETRLWGGSKFQIRRQDAANSSIWVDDVIVKTSSPTTRVDENSLRNKSIPGQFVVYQNYPNPFNPTTTIRYSLPERSNVIIVVANSIGQRVLQSNEGEREAGTHEFVFDASRLATGVYYCKVGTNKFFDTKKLLLIK